MTLDELMNKNRPILDGLALWLEMEAGLTEHVHLREKFLRWSREVKAVQEATRRVECEE